MVQLYILATVTLGLVSRGGSLSAAVDGLQMTSNHLHSKLAKRSEFRDHNSRCHHHLHPVVAPPLDQHRMPHQLELQRGGGTSGTPLLSSSSITQQSPSLSKWMPPALVCATAYALYNLCIKKASSTKPTPMDPLLGGVILQLVAAFMGAALYIFKNFRTMAGATADTVSAPISLMMNGILWSVAAGLSVGMAEILSFVISGMNVKASQSIPTIIGGSVVIGTVLGSVWLREKLTLRGWFGVLLITIGIAIIGIDPGTTTTH